MNPYVLLDHVQFSLKDVQVSDMVLIDRGAQRLFNDWYVEIAPMYSDVPWSDLPIRDKAVCFKLSMIVFEAMMVADWNKKVAVDYVFTVVNDALWDSIGNAAKLLWCRDRVWDWEEGRLHSECE